VTSLNWCVCWIFSSSTVSWYISSGTCKPVEKCFMFQLDLDDFLVQANPTFLLHPTSQYLTVLKLGHLERHRAQNLPTIHKSPVRRYPDSFKSYLTFNHLQSKTTGHFSGVIPKAKA